VTRGNIIVIPAPTSTPKLPARDQTARFEFESVLLKVIPRRIQKACPMLK
jgi:hypothetical protein